MRTSKKLYQNSQWAVTNYGIESLEDPWYYPIAKAELDRRAHYLDPDISSLVIHVCEKRWVDGALFIDAFRRAVEVHAVPNPPDLELSEFVARQSRIFERSLPPRRRRRPGARIELVTRTLSDVAMQSLGYDVAAARRALGRPQ